MITAILNSAMLNSHTGILDSDTLLSSLRFTQKHSHSNLTLTQHNSIWLKLIHSHLTWWWQASGILPTWIWHIGFSHLNFSSLTHSHCQDWFPPFAQKKLHSFILNLMMAAILISANLNSTILDSVILVFPLKLTHICQAWIPPFAPKKLHSFILTQLDDGSHLDFCHLAFSHFAQKNFSHSF